MCHWSPEKETLLHEVQDLKEKNNKLAEQSLQNQSRITK
jgi:hypothetical protein